MGWNETRCEGTSLDTSEVTVNDEWLIPLCNYIMVFTIHHSSFIIHHSSFTVSSTSLGYHILVEGSRRASLRFFDF